MDTLTIECNPTRMLPRGDFNGHDGSWEPRRWVAIGSRGVIVHLRHNERMHFDGQTFEGIFTRSVEIRRWHDGSLTIEREVDR